jgi:lipopolysaccharide export system protein LptA
MDLSSRNKELLFRPVFIAGLLLFIFIFHSENSLGQKKRKVYIENTDKGTLEKIEGRNIQRLIGNVVLRQDSAYFYCDSAVLDNTLNDLEAYGNVHIKYNDSVDIYGDILNYDGNAKIAVLDSNVRLTDKKMVLTTDHLVYNRTKKWAFYNTGGRIVDDENILTSRIGRYFTQSDEFFFRDTVVLVNPDYTLYSDTLMYNTETEFVYIYGPTNIIGEEDSVYSEKGWYDTRANIAKLKQNAFVMHLEQSVRADSIYYNRGLGIGIAYNNVVLNDTLQDILVKGEYAEFSQDGGGSFITDSVETILIDDKDSLFMHADTIRIISDTAGKAEKVIAYYGMKFFRKDLQGKCDSMVYDINDSIIYLYYDPALWSEANQLTGDSIRIFVSHNHIDSLTMYSMAFIISQDDTNAFNQIKGRQMTAYFSDNELFRIVVSGNAETLYYVREEDGSLIGINMSISSYMNIALEDNKVKGITYTEKPDAVLHPEKELSPEQMILRNFIWIEDERPNKKNDIFR